MAKRARQKNRSVHNTCFAVKIVPRDSKIRSFKSSFLIREAFILQKLLRNISKDWRSHNIFQWIDLLSTLSKIMPESSGIKIEINPQNRSRNWSKSHDSHKKCTYEWILPIHALVIPKIDVKGEIPNNWRSDLDHPWSMNLVIAVVVKFRSASVAYWRIIWNFSRPQLGSVSSSNEGFVQVTKCGNLSNNRRR